VRWDTLEAITVPRLLKCNQILATALIVAAVMAEVGKTSEARDLALLDMDLWGLDEPNEQMPVRVRRIVEQFGLPEGALDDDRRVSRPKGELTSPATT
jgi:hypothetical protein